MGLTNEVVRLRGQARKAGIEDYGSMSAAELRTALKSGGGSTGSKRKKRKSVAALSGSKSGRTTRPTRKSSAKKTPAAKSPSRGKAKRSSSGGPTRKPAASSNGSRSGKPGRNLIDRKGIDWARDWAGGTKGNRALIFKALRKHRGNYVKVYAALKADARKMFPKNTKTGERYSADKSRAQLKWYIGRTAFDYVTATGQHEKATNRKPDRRTNGDGAGARKPAAKSGARATPTRKPATAQRSSGTRKAASPRKRSGSTKRKTVKR